MIQPELKTLFSTSEIDLVTWRPIEESFSVAVQAIVGPHNADGEESFDFLICSPTWLASRCESGPMLGAHHLIVSGFNYIEIERFVREFVRRCSGETWNEVANKLQRLGSWEFDGYQE